MTKISKVGQLGIRFDKKPPARTQVKLVSNYQQKPLEGCFGKGTKTFNNFLCRFLFKKPFIPITLPRFLENFREVLFSP